MLIEEGIEAITVPKMPQAMAVMEMNSVDVAIVDGLVEGASEICRVIGRLVNIPVVLTVGDSQIEWERLQSLDIDGYLPEGAGDAEIVARLRAVVRRIARVESVGQKQCSMAE